MASLGRAYVELHGDFSKLEPEVRRGLQDGIDDAADRVDFDRLGDKAGRAGKDAGAKFGDGFFRSVDGKLRDARGRFAREGRLGGESFGSNLISGMSKQFNKVGGLVSGLLRPMSLLKSRMGLLATGFVFLASAALQLGAAIGPALGTLLTIPAGIVGLIGIVAGLSVAFKGLGDAFKALASGDAAKLQEALKNLAPEAQKFVLEIKALGPVFGELRRSIQGAFFAEFNGELTKLATAVLPVLRTSFKDFVVELAVAGKTITSFLASKGSVNNIDLTFKSLRDVIRSLEPALAPLLNVFLTLARAGAPLLDRMAKSFADLAIRFNDFLARADASGQLTAFLDKAFVVAGQLFEVIGNLSSAIFTLFGGAGDASKGLMSSLVIITQHFADFLGQLRDSGALSAIFTALNTVLGVTGNVLAQIIGPIAAALVPVFAALQPVLEQVVGFIGQIAEAAGQVLTAILPAVAHLLERTFGIVGDIFDALGPSLDLLLPEIVKLADALGVALGPVVEAILGALVSLAPVLVQLATEAGPLLVELIEAIIPLLPELSRLFSDIIRIVIDLNEPLTELIVLGIRLAAVLLPLAFKILIPIVAALALFADGLDWVAKRMDAFFRGGGGALVNMWNTIKGLWKLIVDFFTETIPNAIEPALKFIKELPGRAIEFLKGMPGMLAQVAKDAMDGFFQAIGIGIGLTLAAILVLPGKIMEFLSSLPERMALFWAGIWESVKTLTINAVSAIAAYIEALPARAIAATQALGQGMMDAFVSAWNFIKETVRSGVATVQQFIAELPGKIAALGPKMLEAAKGLGRKIGEGLSQIGNFASEVGSKILASMRSGVNAIIDSINSGISKVDDFIPGSLPRLPHFARGGIIDSPTVGVLGEGGKREVVIPLSDPTRARSLAEQSGLLELLGGDRRDSLGDITVHAYLGTREITDILDVRVERKLDQQGRALAFGPREAV